MRAVPAYSFTTPGDEALPKLYAIVPTDPSATPTTHVIIYTDKRRWLVVLAAIVAEAVENAVSDTQNAKGGCVTCGGPVKMTFRGRWRHLVPPKDKHPVRLPDLS